MTLDGIDEEVNEIPDIRGNATDGGTVVMVEWQLYDEDAEDYWDGSDWVDTTKWLEAEADDGAFDEDDEEGLSDEVGALLSEPEAVPAFSEDVLEGPAAALLDWLSVV